jgi:hypothetical protein
VSLRGRLKRMGALVFFTGKGAPELLCSEMDSSRASRPEEAGARSEERPALLPGAAKLREASPADSATWLCPH